ncbi:MAG: hypothetical protein ACRYG7_17920 [Janthinobacterium lividum]
MIMRIALLHLFLLLTASLPTLAINPLWVKLDKKVIEEVSAVVKANPATAEQYFLKPSGTAHHLRRVYNLGFGWKAKETAAYGGYISILATFYYHNDSLLSYTVHPELPDEVELRSTYAKWYATSFRVAPTEVLPFYYNKYLLSKPLPTYKGPYTARIATEAVATYMSPESGLVYGHYGGEALTMLQNRRCFTTLQDSLSPEQVLLLMYAINPASRLTAFEYYLNHKQRFANHLPIEQWMETVFRELPEIESIEGCIGGLYNAREQVASFVKTR